MDYSSLKTEGLNQQTANIDKASSLEIARLINEQDKTVAYAVEKALPQVAEGIDCLTNVLKNDGRIFYVGAGTSGRLGVLDASECPPTYGVSADTVIGIIAGGEKAAFKSIEDAEDNPLSLVEQMQGHNFCQKDVCVGISASGTAPCVIAALDYARSLGAATVAISNNVNTPLREHSATTIVAEVGPEVIKGSTRMKAGTAQKMILNMLSTGSMIKFGRTRGNLMAFMIPSNMKLIDRAIRMICESTDADRDTAAKMLEKHNNVIAYAIDEINEAK